MLLIVCLFFANFVKPVAIMTKKREKKNICVFMLKSQRRSAGLQETSSRENNHIAKWYAFIVKEFGKLSCLGANGYFHEKKSPHAIFTNCVKKAVVTQNFNSRNGCLINTIHVHKMALLW